MVSLPHFGQGNMTLPRSFVIALPRLLLIVIPLEKRGGFINIMVERGVQAIRNKSGSAFPSCMTDQLSLNEIIAASEKVGNWSINPCTKGEYPQAIGVFGDYVIVFEAARDKNKGASYGDQLRAGTVNVNKGYLGESLATHEDKLMEGPIWQRYQQIISEAEKKAEEEYNAKLDGFRALL